MKTRKEKKKKDCEENQILESNFMGLKWDDLLRFFRVCDSASS